MSLTILYRGPLSSCNYDCSYCPFAKRVESRFELERDRRALQRFVDWVADSQQASRVFFTPWGEALVRRWYWQAIERLSLLSRLRKVAIQTNLSSSLTWLDHCDVRKLGFWCTYHPGEVPRERFVDQVRDLERRGVSHSVGVVGLEEHVAEIEALRAELPSATYLWVNAYKRVADYYTADTVRVLSSIDEHFETNNRRHLSYSCSCKTGEEIIAVDGEGSVKRCHFVEEVLGNLYHDPLEDMLRPRVCPLESCGCHIGYVHLKHLGLDRVYGEGLLERVPRARVQQVTP